MYLGAQIWFVQESFGGVIVKTGYFIYLEADLKESDVGVVLNLISAGMDVDRT